MRKHEIVFLVLIGFAVAGITTSCTSKKVDQENSEMSELTGESGGDDEISSSEDEFGAEDANKDGVASEPAESNGEPGAEPLDDFAANDSANPDEPASATDGNSLDAASPADAGTDTAVPEASLDTPSETLAGGAADETQGLSEPEAPRPVIPLQKAATAPYKSGKKNINTIYIAREGDTTKSVAQKIFGENKSAELKAINPTLARRDMKVGDKVYYTSPKRPDDETTMMTYYEDMGMSPEVYMSQPGDNIRTVSQSLLGHKDSWKEVWSLNPDVESKAELAEGTRLRYWPKEASGAPAAPAVADASTLPPPTDTGMTSPPAPPDMGSAGAAAGTTTADMAPPPPMPDEAVPPPPPPPADMPQASAEPPPPPPMAPSGSESLGGLGDDPDQMMALGAGAILLLAAVALFIIIRKKRARRNSPVDFQTATHTQIE